MGYIWSICLGGFGIYCPTETVYPTIGDLENDIATRYPQYLNYYGVDKVEEDEGFWEIVEEVQPIPQTYYEKEEGAN